MKNLFENLGKLPQSTRDSFQKMFEDKTFARIMKTCFLKLADSNELKSQKIGHGGDPSMLFKFLAESLTSDPVYTTEEINNLPKDEKKKIEGYLMEISSSFQENEENPDVSSFLDVIKNKI